MNKLYFKEKISEKLLGSQETKIMQRNFIITEKLIGKRIEIYNGIKYLPLEITENMVGQGLGEFAPTRKKPVFKKKK